MRDYEVISDSSVWLTVTPGEQVKKLPFYLMEIGHFWATGHYMVEREYHDSFLFLYTVNGSGKIFTDDVEFELPKNHVYIMDCHKPHRYFPAADTWEFLWFHMGGCGIAPVWEMLYRDGAKPIQLDIENAFYPLMDSIPDTSFMSSLTISNRIHGIINSIFNAQITPEQTHRIPHYGDIEFAVDFIRKNYASQIAVDDIISRIHMSKYHFIRMFHKIMGMPPYNYITNYRINQAKILLRSTNKTIAEIAEQCGFHDTSNFINHFKKHTGQTPLKYRKDLSPANARPWG